MFLFPNYEDENSGVTMSHYKDVVASVHSVHKSCRVTDMLKYQYPLFASMPCCYDYAVII